MIFFIVIATGLLNYARKVIVTTVVGANEHHSGNWITFRYCKYISFCSRGLWLFKKIDITQSEKLRRRNWFIWQGNKQISTNILIHIWCKKGRVGVKRFGNLSALNRFARSKFPSTALGFRCLSTHRSPVLFVLLARIWNHSVSFPYQTEAQIISYHKYFLFLLFE
jgi:hypothetical protein